LSPSGCLRLEWIDMLIERDVESLLTSGHTFQQFDGSIITILGGTGFIGKWLIQALHEFSSNFGFSSEITVVTRDARNAHRLFVEELGLKLKIAEFDFTSGPTELEQSDFFINGATPSQKKTGLQNMDSLYTSSVNASQSIIRSAKKYGNMPKVVNLSSGIVYGSQELTVRNQIEKSISITSNSHSGYLNAKIDSELIFSEAAAAGLVNSISPRLFAFAGPGIAIDEHFAVGNFLRDGMQEKQIAINGNPSTMRSYMYPTDLTIWLLSAVLEPKNLNINIGSETPISMLDLANLISDMTSRKGVKILGDDQDVSNYVPSTLCFRETYGVSEQIDVSSGLERWIEWLIKSEIF
jgi:nucleoside-diphosphate-sugar epimerase